MPNPLMGGTDVIAFYAPAAAGSEVDIVVKVEGALGNEELANVR